MVPVPPTRIRTIILTGKDSHLSILFPELLNRFGSPKIVMAHTITLIRTEARTTTVATAHRHTQLPAAAALAKSESCPSSTIRV